MSYSNFQEDISMNTLTIIGNGFDRAHSLPTLFDQFIDSNVAYFSQKYAIFKGEGNSWAEIEKFYANQLRQILENRNWHDVLDEVEQIIHEYGFNEYGEVNYFNFSSTVFEDEYEEITSRVALLTEFEKEFLQYLRKNCSNSLLTQIPPFSNLRQILKSSSRIINFNYTNTVETVYGIVDVEHIHGSIETSIAIGSGSLNDIKNSLINTEYPSLSTFSKDKYGFQELLGYYDYDEDGNLHPHIFIERFFNEVVSSTLSREEEIFNLLDAKNKDVLSSRIKIIDSFKNKHYDKVYIIGHSLGEPDYSVFDAINKDAEVICFYYSDNDKEQMSNVLKRLGMKYTLKSTTEIYN